MPFPALKEAQGRLDAKRKELHTIFDQAGPDIDMTKVTSIDGDSKAKVKAINDLDTEINVLADEVVEYLKVEAAAERARKARDRGEPDPTTEPGDGNGKDDDKPQTKSFGELFVASHAYKGRVRSADGPGVELDVDVKTLMTTTAGWAPETFRTGRVVDFATRPIQVVDIIPDNTTSQNAIVYMEETTFTNNAAEAAEGGTYAEAALGLTEQSSPVRKITIWLPVTDEQLEDERQARGYLNNRLPFMLRQRLDGQILNGNGTAPNLRGFLNVVGVQTQAKGADPTPDAFYKAMTKVMVTGQAIPNAHIIHPNDWQDIRLLRTADGIYIWGSPSEAGPARLWGLPVIQAQAITENTGLTGDFQNFTELSIRRGVDVQVSNSHSTHFVEGKQAVRADVRVALPVYRPAALCSVTGI